MEAKRKQQHLTYFRHLIDICNVSKIASKMQHTQTQTNYTKIEEQEEIDRII